MISRNMAAKMLKISLAELRAAIRVVFAGRAGPGRELEIDDVLEIDVYLKAKAGNHESK